MIFHKGEGSMGEIQEELIRKIIRQVREISLTGQTECCISESRSDKYMYDADMDIHWNTVERQFLLVYIESYGNDNSYYYRIYRCAEGITYDRRTVLDPVFENEDFCCLFDYKESNEQRELVRCYDDGSWLDEFEEAIVRLILIEDPNEKKSKMQ